VGSIARWDGASWWPLGTGVQGQPPSVRALTVFNDQLIVGGYFKTAGGLVSSYWARWGTPLPASILTDPAPTSTCRTGAATFTLTASGTGPLLYRWRHEGADLTDGPTGTGSIVSGAATQTLRITSATAPDAGTYDCVVSNSCATATSAAAHLTVCLADYNCDTFVDGIDYDQFNNDFESGSLSADINGDGFLDGIDYDLFNNQFEAGCS
jgi:hypothetical protein